MISTNTQAILLLTAPLITGQSAPRDELLSHSEYQRLARELRELGHTPAELLATNVDQLIAKLETVPADRIRRLLERGFLLTQAIERWQSRAIWVISRADPEYPKRIKNRLKDESPALLYGCGQKPQLENGGLAVVGSRHVEPPLLSYAEAIGQQCAAAKKSTISGGAQGIDRAAMRGALEAGGRVIGILADSLERAVLNRENRNWLLEEQLVLVSPYDPSAGFNVGHAMQRNKLIYALADAALIASAEFEKGGTWTGAIEQLQKFRFIPVYVRSTGEIGPGLDALVRKGAQRWPNPQDSHQLLAVFNQAATTPSNQNQQLDLAPANATAENEPSRPAVTNGRGNGPNIAEIGKDSSFNEKHHDLAAESSNPQRGIGEPRERLLATLREIFADLLITPKKDSEIALLLQVSNTQARLWLHMLVREGFLEKLSKPVRFVTKQKTLL